MAKHRVTIVQAFKAFREITVEVEADTLDLALQQQGENCAPGFDDPGWKTSWDLQNEEVRRG